MSADGQRQLTSSLVDETRQELFELTMRRAAELLAQATRPE
ncbi:hypothetical protein ACX27O_15300 [Micromonospora sp. SD19]